MDVVCYKHGLLWTDLFWDIILSFRSIAACKTSETERVAVTANDKDLLYIIGTDPAENIRRWRQKPNVKISGQHKTSSSDILGLDCQQSSNRLVTAVFFNRGSASDCQGYRHRLKLQKDRHLDYCIGIHEQRKHLRKLPQKVEKHWVSATVEKKLVFYKNFTNSKNVDENSDCLVVSQKGRLQHPPARNKALVFLETFHQRPPKNRTSNPRKKQQKYSKVVAWTLYAWCRSPPVRLVTRVTESEVFGWSQNRICLSDSRNPMESFLHRTPKLEIPVDMVFLLCTTFVSCYKIVDSQTSFTLFKELQSVSDIFEMVGHFISDSATLLITRFERCLVHAPALCL